MKGFIEVVIIDENNRQQDFISINIKSIAFFRDKEIRVDRVSIYCAETYEEIKKKIQEAE